MSSEATPFVEQIARERLERELPDGKPLLTPGEARAEAERCLFCHDAPCVTACPTEIDIPLFIKKIASGNVTGSANTIFESNILGYSCGRVCPVEVLCVGACVYNDWHRAPIQIGKLQRYATETVLARAAKTGKTPLTPKPKTAASRRVALIGGGPASLACAAALALEGHHAVIFERSRLPGGLNTTGVAPYKLHADDALREVDFVASLGVEIRTGIEIGSGVSTRSLLGEYDAVFIGIGLGADTRLNVPGEEGPGIFGATAFIERLKNDPGFSVAGIKQALVVGGGNTAIDVARELALLGVPDVAMVYRRSAQQMTGYAHEMSAARLEGARLIERAQPVAVIRDEAGNIRSLRVALTENGVPVAGTEHDLPCDTVVLAIGQSKLRALASELPGVELDGRGCVIVEGESRRTGNPRVYAGGDCINGGKEVVNAVADGRDAARAMMRAWAEARGAEKAG
ncbi:MAG TPA: FAD-dependent oxidoreductase [Polyangiaceae bacterium]|jgi:glutamate synthase (NADPH/NADH) small chain|nr:FAD-dependent oxidoreductase [Polyangiaceae bacterium]